MTSSLHAANALLDSWLNLTSILWNTRLVSSLTYNETRIMGLLFQNQAEEKPMTATDLIRHTRLLKSQMNKTLTALEKCGYIARTRNEADKRQILIRLTDEGESAYLKEHRDVEAILLKLIDQIGPDHALGVASELNRLTELLDEIVPASR